MCLYSLTPEQTMFDYDDDPYYDPAPDNDEGDFDDDGTCNTCDGTGEGSNDYTSCRCCGGSGSR